MKKFLKSAGLPIGVFALAIGSAFATNVVKNAQTIVPGYQKIDELGLVCDEKTMCSIVGDEPCTWTDASNIEHTLYDKEFNPVLNETVCTFPLSRITP
ncbi:DUF6520 family protein [Myroides odoratimimus]|uniref:DUF6520 family protein n=1 Tax=Myroides odoratimimus TaxID=76832 RepID=UPI0025761108|nr:DUF6520 family protein [Myroides odoratimimus]MDM1530747.1 hypothetical protein [Myroides odoratimimus]MEC4078008.1 DUF6520 family protein [Myroides odoratimimus]